MSTYFTPESLAEIRKIDLLTYLQHCEPDELVRVNNTTYTTRTHDSLKISNGLWKWFSQDIGGRSALDYLIKVKGMTFIDAVNLLKDQLLIHQTMTVPSSDFFMPENKGSAEKKPFVLPEKNDTCKRIFAYLCKRGIDKSIISTCLNRKLIYESLPYHNVVFVGYDENNAARYAGFRAANDKRVLGDVSGSDKAYAFHILNQDDHGLHLFEGAIDLLSYATLLKEEGKDWTKCNYAALAGVAGSDRLHPALERILKSRPDIATVYIHFDNDPPGRLAAQSVARMLKNRVEVIDCPPKTGKDYNDALLSYKANQTQMKGDKTHEPTL